MILHIINGDETFQVFEQTGLIKEGVTAVWREILIDGPVAAKSLAEFWQIRQEYLSATYGETTEEYQNKVLSEWEKIAASSIYQEIVLWFEFDSFCQVNIWFLLNWFAEHPPPCRISLICPGEFPGIHAFKGLAQLSASQLESLWPNREVLGTEDLTVCRNIWKAYGSSDPRSLQNFLHEYLRFPYFFPAISNHLRRFPSEFNGLNFLEHKLLDCIGKGWNQPGKLFEKIWNEERTWGITDLQMLNYLLGLRNAKFPALTISDLASINQPNLTNLPLWRFNLTEYGEQVLIGEKDWIAENGIERWLGGVHLYGKKIPWRWNDDKKRFSPD